MEKEVEAVLFVALAEVEGGEGPGVLKQPCDGGRAAREENTAVDIGDAGSTLAVGVLR